MADDPLSEEDKRLFREAMETVKPLDKSLAKEDNLCRKHKSFTHLDKNKNPAEPVYLSSNYTEPVNADTVLSYCKTGIPQKRFKALKLGQIPCEARLDLHGLRVDDAADALREFISSQCAKGHRCLLIIHGKGGYRGESPIIKSYVNHWLKQFNDVLAFHSALPRAGGTGSVYVLLKRYRNED